MSNVHVHTFSVEYTCRTPEVLVPQTWNYRKRGMPTAKNLAKDVQKLADSFKPGGSNSHIQRPITILEARVIDHRNGQVAAFWRGECSNQG